MGTGIGLALLAGASFITSAVGSAIEGKQARESGRIRSQILRQDAKRREEQSKQDADEFRRRESRLLARQRAGFAASGVTFEGTPLLIGGDTAQEIELQAQKILVSGLNESAGLQSEANLAEFEGRQAQTLGFMEAGSTLLGGAFTMEQSDFFGNGGGNSRVPRSSRNFGH